MKSWLDNLKSFSLPDISKEDIAQFAENAKEASEEIATWVAEGVKDGAEKVAQGAKEISDMDKDKFAARIIEGVAAGMENVVQEVEEISDMDKEEIAARVVEGVKNGVDVAAQGAKDIYQRGLDDYEKYQETKRIQKLCEDGQKSRDERVKEYVRDFEKERATYNALIPTINEQLSEFVELQLLVERGSESVPHMVSEDDKKLLEKENASSESFFTKNPVLTGSLAGMSTGIGTVGLMTLFGKAGTGVALSKLTGVAYVKATLAALGGGTLAHGGAGILGGAAFLGAAIIAPAVVVTGYFTDKSINDDYLKAKEDEKIELQVEEEAELTFQKLSKGLCQFRQLSMELYVFSKFFGEMLNMSREALKIERNKQQFLETLQYAAEVLYSFASIRFLSQDGELNTNFEEEYEGILEEEKKCRERLNAYRRAIDPERQELLDQSAAKTLKIDELKRELTEKSEKEEEYKLLVAELQQELQNITNEKELAEKVESFYSPRLEEMAARQPDKFGQILTELDAKFHDLGEKALLMLATGEFHFRWNETMDENLDFGGTAIEYGKSIECILQEILRREEIIRPDETLTIGKSMAYVHKKRNGWERWVQKSLEIVGDIRNKAAHKNVVSFKALKKLRKVLFEENEASKESLLEYLHHRIQ